MNEKKQHIIDVGLALFSQKGYHATSIQEIANEAGISKGSFYLYFESKEDFIATAFEFFHEQLSERLHEFSGEELAPRDLLAKQITSIMTYMLPYKHVIIMYMRENISIGEKMDALITKVNTQNFHWLQNSIQQIYGQKVKAFQFDAIILLEGIIQSYFKSLVMGHIEMDVTSIGSFIVRRLDDLVNGMLEKEKASLLNINTNQKFKNSNDKTIEAYVSQLQSKIDELVVLEMEKRELQEVMDALQKELVEPQPQAVLIRGLLAQLQRHRDLIGICEQLADELDIRLIEEV
ncbi:TetR/AcrR family transcriptional regulator [Virgibacillus soli]